MIKIKSLAKVGYWNGKSDDTFKKALQKALNEANTNVRMPTIHLNCSSCACGSGGCY